jgi:cytoskeletal protein RodZ
MITNVGSLLKAERKKQHITLDEVEKKTRIRKKNLQAIEAEQWEAFPSRTYIQGIITQYARFLGLDEHKLIAYFRRAYEHLEHIKFKERTVKQEFTPRRKLAILVAVICIVLFFIGFFGYQTYLYVRPPELVILEPTRTTFKRSSKVTLRGQAPPETIVRVNDRETFLDENNIFQIDVPLTKERNLVVIEATGANGRKTVIRKVFIRSD